MRLRAPETRLSRPLTRAVGVTLVGVVLAATTVACGDSGGSDDAAGDGKTVSCDYPSGGTPAKQVDKPSSDAPAEGSEQATMKLGTGTLTLDLDTAAAPCTVNSFVSLAEQGYFDDTPCIRVTTSPGFEVLQCGDPTGTQSGGPGYTIPDEYTGDETYTAGTLAMANTGAPDSGGSQFFIVYGDTQLDPAYTVFGTVEKGLDVVEAIGKAGTADGGPDGAPKQDVTIESVTVD